MSKEQTPIKAEGFLDAKGFLMDDFGSYQRYLLIRDLMEQYAQAKVLQFAKWERSNLAHLNFTSEELVEMFLKQK